MIINGLPERTAQPVADRLGGSTSGWSWEITAGLFDFPAEELAAAGRVLSIVTARANAVLAGQGAGSTPA